MFPRSLLVVFIITTLLVTGGSMVSVATNENMSNQEKVARVAMKTLKTPDSIDTFCAQSIRAYSDENANFGLSGMEGMEGALKKFSLALAIISAIALVLIGLFVYRLVKWLFGFARPPESEQRLDILAILIALVLMGALTWYTTPQVLLGML